MGVESEFLENVTRERWTVKNRLGKWKQTKLAKEILEDRDNYHVLMWGSKHPAWDLFGHIRFDIIVLETVKKLGANGEHYSKLQKIRLYICERDICP